MTNANNNNILYQRNPIAMFGNACDQLESKTCCNNQTDTFQSVSTHPRYVFFPSALELKFMCGLSFHTLVNT